MKSLNFRHAFGAAIRGEPCPSIEACPRDRFPDIADAMSVRRAVAAGFSSDRQSSGPQVTALSEAVTMTRVQYREALEMGLELALVLSAIAEGRMVVDKTVCGHFARANAERKASAAAEHLRWCDAAAAIWANRPLLSAAAIAPRVKTKLRLTVKADTIRKVISRAR